jgi:Cu-processing system permease protein
MNKLIKYIIIDILRNKVILFYTLALFLISLSVFNFSDAPEKAIVSMLNVELIVVPLICAIFSAIYFYNSSEFIELLTSQPLKRRTIFISLLFGLVLSLCIAFMVGTGIPLLLLYPVKASFLFLASGLGLTMIFCAFALTVAVYASDKARGVGIVLLIWFYFTMLYDGLVLFLMFQFSDYPIEKAMIFLACLNPVDLVRILNILQIDISAIMGYTGAIFKDYFGTTTGISAAVLILLVWYLLPTLISTRRFLKKDL